jgi:hypothetical protein
VINVALAAPDRALRLVIDTLTMPGNCVLAVSLAFFWQTCGSPAHSA